MKKIVASVLIILVILNSYVPSSLAADISPEGFNGLLYEGQEDVPAKDGNTITSVTESLDASSKNNRYSLITILLEILAILPKAVNWVMSQVVLHGRVNYVNNEKQYSIYTIQDMLLGKFSIFDINFFYKSGNSDGNSNTINTLKDNVAIWYVAIRNIALVGSALIIIYVAIRLAIATSNNKPADKARYNKMLMSWVVGFILIFTLQYIVRFLFIISDLIINLINKTIIKGSTEANLEKDILTNSWNHIEGAKGINKLVHVVVYYALVYYEAKFFIMYFKRLFEVFFLMIISPLVCMLYPIDFIGDSRSQSFSAWFKMLLADILMQPIHLAIFIIFAFTASELSSDIPIIYIAFFAALGNGEKIIKTLFGISGPNLRDIKFGRLKRPRLRRR